MSEGERSRAVGFWVARCAIALVLGRESPAIATSIFADGFECSDPFAWTGGTPEPPAGDSCSSAPVLTLGANLVSDSTQAHRGDYTASSCGGVLATAGRDAVYRLTVPAGFEVRVEVAAQPGFDAVLYASAIVACPAPGEVACAAGADAGGPGEPETLDLPALPTSQDYLIAVDSAAAGGCGGEFDIAASVRSRGGPGHLILIGHDYTPPLGGTPAGLAQLLVNSAAQAHAATLARPLEVAVLEIQTAPTEVANVEAILDAPLNVQFQEIQLPELEAALGGADVLLIPDQNGVFVSGDPIAAASEPALRQFLDAGGVIVVLDGTVDGGGSPDASHTYRILDPSLLDVDASERILVEQSASVPCNTADPVLQGAGPVPAGAHSVRYATPEPWVALWSSDVTSQGAFVLHRWFGHTESGPIGIRAGDASGVDLSGFDVFFQDLNSSSLAWCTTLPNGTAVHQMPTFGEVSFGFTDQVSQSQLITFTQVEPLDDLDVSTAPAMGGGEPYERMVVLPGAFPEASSYRVMLGCGSQVGTEPTTIAVATTTGCANLDGTFNVIAEAIGELPGEILAFSMVNGLSDSSGSEVLVPAWQPANLALDANLPAFGVDVVGSVQLFVDRIAFSEGGTGNAQPLAANFYTSPGSGFPAFSRLSREALVTFETVGGGQYEPRGFYRMVGSLPPPGTLTLDLQALLLPRLTFVSLVPSPPGSATLVWNSAGPTPTADGAVGRLFWGLGEGFVHSWVLIGPGTGGLLSGPGPPSTPVDPYYWPGPEASLLILNLAVEDASNLEGYRDYRQAPFRALDIPAAGTFTGRSTRLILAIP